MKLVVIFLAIFLSALSFAQTYESIKLMPGRPDHLTHVRDTLKDSGFWALSPHEEFETIGLNQIFFDGKARGFIAVKHDVRGDVVLDQLLPSGEGQLLHIKLQERILAFYFKGIEAPILEAVLAKLKHLDLTMKGRVLLRNVSPLPSAQADCGEAPFQEISKSSAVGVIEAVTTSTLSGHLWSCLQGAKNGAVDALGGTLVDAGKAITQEAKEFWKNPSGKSAEYFKAVDGVITGFQGLIHILGECLTNPVSGSAKLRAKFGEAGALFSEVISKMVLLPAQAALEMICSFISGVGVNGLITLITGGAGAVGLVAMLGRTGKSLEGLNELFAQVKKMKLPDLSGLGLDKNTMTKLFAKIKQGTLDERKLKIFNESLVSDSPVVKNLALSGLQCHL